MITADQSTMTMTAATERTILRPIDHQAFFAALDAAPEPTKQLRTAFARHHNTITSR